MLIPKMYDYDLDTEPIDQLQNSLDLCVRSEIEQCDYLIQQG